MSVTKTASLVGTIDSLLGTLGNVKTAEALSEPGSQGGATTHPSKSVDDSLQTATEGSQSATNEKDVKADQPLGVDSAEAGGGGSQNDKQMDIGITSKPTGEDSAAETDSAKAGKDDPGSTHPARTDNDALDGMKYASQAAKVRAFAKHAEAKGNALTAAIAANADASVKAAAKPIAAKPAGKPGVPAPAAVAAPKVASQAPAAEAATAGSQLAENVTSDMDKQAADAILIDAMAETVAVAEDAAVRAVNYLRKCARTQLRKKAEGDDGSDPHKDEDSDNVDDGGASDDAGDHGGGGDAGGPPMDSSAGGGDAGAGGGGGGPSDDELMAALSGGGDMGGGDAMQGMAGGGAGAPPMPGGGPGAGDMAPTGGDPMGGGLPGGMPPDAAGGGPGAPPTGGDAGGMGAPGSGGDLSPEDLAILSHVLAQAGVTPEALEAAATAKQAAALRMHKAAGKPVDNWRPKNATEAKTAAAMLDYVRELTGRKA